jgi:hypothetical protein
MYESTSGQKLNSTKTSIFVFFSKNTNKEFRAHIRSILGIQDSTSVEKYLGLLSMVGRAKMQTFAYIQGRVRSKLEGWKSKFLSQAGKEILLKAVIQAIPSYCMRVFLLPKTIVTSLHSMMNRFWWGSPHNQSRVSWMSWTRLGKAKNSGGLDFRDLKVFNLAMLAKQGWRILHHPNSLVARIMQAKCYSNATYLEAHLGRRPSNAWRSILHARAVLEEGLIWRVGNGERISVWRDKWLPIPSTFKVQSSVNLLSDDA